MEKKIVFFISFLMMSYIGTQYCYGQDLKKDSVYLSIYIPTEEGIVFLDKLLNSEHQWLDEKGTYILTQSIYSDSLTSIKVNYDSTLKGIGLNDFLAKKYVGCVLYRNKLFFLDNTFKEENNLFFRHTAFTKSFADYGATIINVINDKIITWTFVFIDGQIVSESVSPLSTIANFKECDFE